ncbi:hypothetical protein CDO73_01430 [Saccharibacillus sp. O23]|nr:hypothetical protein CDO73_01430 [Saccharibacillus sp. O23]
MKPIFEIMTDRKEIFIKHWEDRSEEYLSLREPAIREVLEYTQERLIELKAYLNRIRADRRTKRILGFYREHVELLLKDHQKEIKGYPGNYMYFYNELLLGSERYLTIKNELKKLGCEIE